MTMNDKKIDNRIINDKKVINKLDNRIEEEKKRLKEVNDMQEEFISFNRTMANCLGLLSSVKANQSRKKYSEMYNKNTSILMNVTNILDEEIQAARNNLRNFSETTHKKNNNGDKER